MTHWEKKLTRDQLDQKLKLLKSAPSRPTRGWIKSIREALGMTATQLGKRIGVNQSRITHMEQAEIDDNLKLSTLNKAAEGLGMKFIYGFVPKDSLEDVVRDQAKKLVLKRMERLDHTMRLELQNLSNSEKEKAINDMVDRVLIEGDKKLWEIK